ncbi:beta-ketoacyl synthase N-terminal-like domain-containing protein [Streptomyces sp. NPDC005529]|uniref:type I polyketide synthase n=1 Tax=unclassified Streptomyces TaxID=2593676 RepID=UPI0033A8E557
MTILSADTTGGTRIAVIGMAGRFPGASDIGEFWRNLCKGRGVITPDAPPATGSPQNAGPGNPAAFGALRDADHFDAGFFGLSSHQALVMDPQQRVLMETASHALEDAGYDPLSCSEDIGLYAGGNTTRHRAALEAHRGQLPFLDDRQIHQATAPDFLAMPVAQRLRLHGPVICVQSACSTSLVAVHLACQALLAGECDIALAGGVAVHVEPAHDSCQDQGHALECDADLPFAARSRRPIESGAAALVVLKPLDKALADGDHVHAVVRGTAVCNDAGDTAGFTLASIAGRARAVRKAQLVADVSARSITYLESLSAGTLGDPLEVAALTKAFRADTNDNGFCRLGSAQTSIGHVGAAAGVTGLIKTILAVEHALIPPSPTENLPAPGIRWNASPFRVVTDRLDWPRGQHPRRAGVNARSLSGTNAHVIVEEPPYQAPSTSETSPQLLILSARSTRALEETTKRLSDELAARPHESLADVAWTLQTGRTAHPRRRFAVADSTTDAATILGERTRGRVIDVADAPTPPPTALFMFPGHGNQRLGMARGLYADEAAFRWALDECSAYARPELGLDMRDVLMPEERGADRAEAARLLETTAVGQPALFMVEYALAQLWQSWQVRPAAVVGHDLGAYAAATIAKVFTLPDAVRLVIERGRLLHSLSAEDTLTLHTSEAQLLPLLPRHLTVTAVDGPQRCTISGPTELIQAVAADLTERGIPNHRLSNSASSHSAPPEPALKQFERIVAGLDLQGPRIPFLSDITGTWAVSGQLTDPAYWSAHLRSTLRFGQALESLTPGPHRLLLETGPGNTLTELARQHSAVKHRHQTVRCMPRSDEATSERNVLLTAAGHLWAAGIPLAWKRMHASGRRTVKLPLYPFDRQRYRLESPSDRYVNHTRTSPPSKMSSEPADGLTRCPPAEDPTEEHITRIIADRLNLKTAGPHDNFFDLGIDPHTTVQLAAWIRLTFAINFPLTEIFRTPNAAGLAATIARRRAARP